MDSHLNHVECEFKLDDGPDYNRNHNKPHLMKNVASALLEWRF